MGITGRFDDARFDAALNRIRALTRQRNVPCGIHVVAPEPAQLRLRISEGYRFLAYSIDSVFLVNAARRDP
jgi:2-dehydro-3-deoxyglucarate aldolase